MFCINRDTELTTDLLTRMIGKFITNEQPKLQKWKNYYDGTVVDYINNKRTLEVGIIPLDDTAMAALQSAIDDFSVSISFRNPRTNELEANVSCIIPTDTVEYYTIQVGKVMYKAFVLQFIEL